MRICRLNTFSWSSMSPAVSSSPHSPTATHSAAANFSSIQHQLTFFTALGCTPQVWSTLMLPIDAGILVIHSSQKTELVTTASNPANSAEAWDSANAPSALSIVAFQPTRWHINSRWQCPWMATAPDNIPAEPSTSGAWRTCDLTSSGTSASRRIIVLQWRRAATSLGEGVATVSTVPLQYAANCFPKTSRLTMLVPIPQTQCLQSTSAFLQLSFCNTLHYLHSPLYWSWLLCQALPLSSSHMNFTSSAWSSSPPRTLPPVSPNSSYLAARDNLSPLSMAAVRQDWNTLHWCSPHHALPY